MGRLEELLKKERTPLLQLALDFTSLGKVLQILYQVYDLPIDIIEVGTPLIKSLGLSNLHCIRELLNDRVILADTKTADAGEVEVSLVHKVGFNALTVLGSTDNEVIVSTLGKANQLGLDVVVDLIGIRDIIDRALELKRLGVKIFNIHVGIDVQRLKGLTVTDKLSIVRDFLRNLGNDVYISVSGGIKPKDVVKFKDLGVHIIVIGSAITKASNPRKRALEALTLLGKKSLRS